MIEIHLYGKLRLHFRDSIYREGDVLRVYPDPGETRRLYCRVPAYRQMTSTNCSRLRSMVIKLPRKDIWIVCGCLAGFVFTYIDGWLVV